jgi:gamma-glutamyl-gamma-aminobutyrate hydrolase PuuD
MQLINVTMNDGTLYYIDHINDDPDDVSHLDVSAPANHTNEVELFSGTELSDEIIRASSSHIIEMASAHHMAIARPGEGLIVAGRSIGKTRIVKFLTSKDGNVLGVQGHPEFQLEAPYSRAIGGLLMRHAAEYHQNKTFMMQR